MKDSPRAYGVRMASGHNVYKVNTRCRICKSQRLLLWLDLGEQPLANSFLREENLSDVEPRYPLRVYYCENCSLSQLIDIVNPEVLFRNYIYFSSHMPRVSEHWRRYAEEVVRNFAPSRDDFVVEIGSNDGVLLGAIKELGARILGVDPAHNIAQLANSRGITTLPEFFSAALARQIVERYGRARSVIANNVVAHIDDHQDLLTGVCDLMEADGVFVFEAPYLVDMFENLTFDTIYHEHMSHLCLYPLIKLLDQFALDIFDAKTFPIQGNSIRIYACKQGKRKIQPSVACLLKREERLSLHRPEPYSDLALKISGLRDEVRSQIYKFKNRGKRIAAYGAPAKGNTLLNYFGIGAEIIDFATEELKSKIGLYTPGMHLPVVDIQWARKKPPDYYLLLAWNYKDAVLAKEAEFLSRGGKFIMPVGQTRIIP
jgi:hypothetical protein